MNRIEQLQQFISEDPTDEFLRYALALEYLKVNPKSAQDEFEKLIQHHPDYLPTYYPAAHLMIELGNSQAAEQLFIKGIDVARRQSNTKTEMELNAAYRVWQLERE